MRQHRHVREQALRDHPHVGSRIRRSDKRELMALIHKRTNYSFHVGAELLDQARINVELNDLALCVTLQCLMEGNLPLIAKAYDF